MSTDHPASLPATMRAMTVHHGRIEVCDIPTPIPGPGQVLIRTLACAVCASDHHYLDHPEVAREDRSGMRVHAPTHHVVMGHEFCGELVAYGPDTAQRWPLGTRLTSPPALFTPDGMRIIGMAPDAPGGFGEYLLLTEGFARELPQDVPAEHLALVDAMAVGRYYTRVGTERENTVPLVIGLGAIGLSVVAALKLRGATSIVASDHSASRRELARQLGADILVDPSDESPYEAWRRAAWGSPDPVHDRVALQGRPTCVAYECVGVTGVLGDLVRECEIGTQILSAGGAAHEVIDGPTAHLKGINLQFGGGPAMSDWYEAMDQVATGVLDVAPLVGPTVSLTALPEAFEQARDSSAPVRLVWTP